MPKKPKSLVYKINFLKGDQTGLASIIVNWISYLGLPIMLVVAAIVLGSALWKLSLDQQLADLQAEVAVVAKSIKSQAGLENQLNAITAKYKDIQDWQAEKITILLPRLALVVPPEINLDGLTVSNDSVRFSGTAADKQAITDLVNNINNIKNVVFDDGEIVDFYDTRIDSLVTTTLVTSSFNFSVSFKYLIGDAPAAVKLGGAGTK